MELVFDPSPHEKRAPLKTSAWEATGGVTQPGLGSAPDWMMPTSKHYPDLAAGEGKSAWNFCARLSDVDFRGNHRWRREMSVVSSGRGQNESEAKKS